MFLKNILLPIFIASVICLNPFPAHSQEACAPKLNGIPALQKSLDKALKAMRPNTANFDKQKQKLRKKVKKEIVDILDMHWEGYTLNRSISTLRLQIRESDAQVAYDEVKARDLPAEISEYKAALQACSMSDFVCIYTVRGQLSIAESELFDAQTKARDHSIKAAQMKAALTDLRVRHAEYKIEVGKAMEALSAADKTILDRITDGDDQVYGDNLDKVVTTLHALQNQLSDIQQEWKTCIGSW